MQTTFEQILSFLISGTLGWVWVIIKYSNTIRNDKKVKLRWFVAEMATGFLLAWSSYTLLPQNWLEVPLAIFIWYFSHTILDVFDKKVPNYIDKKVEKILEDDLHKNE